MSSLSFRIHYDTPFGFAVYLAGSIPELGNWELHRAIKLTWNHNNWWTCTIELPSGSCNDDKNESLKQLKHSLLFDYKYFVSRFNSPNMNELRWEAGPNRSINLSECNKTILNIHDTWEYKKVILRVIQSKKLIKSSPCSMKEINNNKKLSSNEILLIDKFSSFTRPQSDSTYSSSSSESSSSESQSSPLSKSHLIATASSVCTSTQPKERYYVTADIEQLGDLKKLHKMHKHTYTHSQNQQSQQSLEQQQSNSLEHLTNQDNAAKQKYEIIFWEKQFLVKSSVQNLRYRYAYKSENHENDFVERKTHRINFSKNDIDATGAFSITDQNTHNQFSYDSITDNIFLGPYPENSNQISNLSSKGVRAILNLQSSEDFKSHFTDMEVIKRACVSHNIKQLHFPVTDMNVHEMASKLPSLVYQLSRAIEKYQCVYVHCTSGIFRSAQVVIAYLHLHMNYSVNAAIAFVESKRPVTKKNREYLRQVYAIRGGYSSLLKPLSEQQTSSSSGLASTSSKIASIHNFIAKKQHPSKQYLVSLIVNKNNESKEKQQLRSYSYFLDDYDNINNSLSKLSSGNNLLLNVTSPSSSQIGIKHENNQTEYSYSKIITKANQYQKKSTSLNSNSYATSFSAETLSQQQRWSIRA